MPTIVRTFVIVIVLAGLFVGTASLRKGQVEGSLTLKATAALIDAVPELRDEAEWKVSFVGNEGIVHGRIASRTLLEKTGNAIERIQKGEILGLEFVSRIYNGLQFCEPATLSISTLSSGSVSVEGKLSAAFIEELRLALRAIVQEGTNIDDGLQIHRELSRIPWGQELLSYLPDFLEMGNGYRLTIADNRVTLGGVVVSEGEKERLGSLAVSYLGDAFSIFENRLGVIANRKPAYATVLFVAPDILRVSGALPSASAKDELMSQLEGMVPAGCRITDELQVDYRLSEGDWYLTIPKTVPKLLKYAMMAKLEFEGSRVDVAVEAISERGRSELRHTMAALYAASDYELTTAMKLVEGGALRLVTAADKPVPAAPMVPVSMPSGNVDPSETALLELIEGTVIYFKINSAMLGAEDVSNLKSVGKALSDAKSRRVVLRGFTDRWGNAKLNQELAARRCRSVRKILLMHGVEEHQLRIEPWSDALVSADPDEPSWKKRRVSMQLERVAENLVHDSHQGFELRKPILAAVPRAALVSGASHSDALQQADVYFGLNSFVVRRSELSKLRSISRIVANQPSKDVVISGFCDKWGNRDYNLYLSKKRCEAVRAHLIDLGLPQDRLVIEEKGSDGAIEEDGPNWKKRRVEFRLREPQQFGASSP